MRILYFLSTILFISFFNFSFGQTYCSIGYTDDAYISDVEIDGSSIRTSVEDGGYINTGISFSLAVGQSFSVTTDRLGDGSFNYFHQVWFDWDDDGTFEDSYNMGSGSSPNSETQSGIIVPASAAGNTLKMRTTLNFNQYLSSSPCSSDGNKATWGEVEDYDVIVASLCTSPSATFAVFPNCVSDFMIDVTVSDLGDATAVDVSDGGVTAGITNVTTGIHSMGPYSPGDSISITVDGSVYGGCVLAASDSLTESCICSVVPTATVASANLNCISNTYDIQVTINSDGSGDIDMSDILIDGVIEQVNATTGNLYTFNKPSGSYTITLEAEGAGFVSCISSNYNVSQSCNNDECADAFTVLTNGTPITSLDVSTYTSSSTNLTCDAGSSDEDAWYSFVAPASGMVIVDIYDSNLSGTNSNRIEGALYNGCGGTVDQCFGYSSSNLGSASTASGHGRLVTGLIAGNNYFLEIEHYDDDWSGTYDVIIIDAAPSLEMGVLECADFSMNTQDISDLDCNTCSTSDPDWMTTSDKDKVWTYVPTTTGTIDIIVSNIDNITSGEEMGFVLTTDLSDVSCGLASECNNANASGDLTAIGINVNAGTTYYLIVLVNGFSSTPSGTFCAQINSVCGVTSTNSIISSDCATQTYTGRVTISNLGGIGTTYDLEDDDGNTFTNITTSTNYDFSYTDISNHVVQVNGYDGSSNLVCVEEITLSAGCTPNVCIDALDILGLSVPVDLSAALDDANEMDSDEGSGDAGEPTFIGMGNGSTLSNCGSGPQHSAYYYTDFNDLWYVIDIPDGADQFSVTFTGLSCPVAVLPYSGTCGSLTLMDITGGAGIGIVDSDNDGTIESGQNQNPIISSDGVIHFKDNSVATASTGPIYLRIIGHDNLAAGTNCNAADIGDCSFTISASSIQENDICNDAVNINSFDDDVLTTDSYLPVTQSSDISQANLDLDTHEEVDGETCNGITFNTTEEDLWFSIKTPPTGQFYVDLDIDFTGTEDEIYVLLHNYCSAGDTDPIGCASISADGITSFDASNITNFETALTPDDEFNVRIVLPTGSTANSFDISANLIAVNTDCEVMQNVFPGFDIESVNADANFNFANESGAVPAILGRDLWYQFDPQSAVDIYGELMASTHAEIIIGGLAAGEQLTLVLYKGNTVSGNNCNDLAPDYLETLIVAGNGTVQLSCLDESHTSVDGGYLLRVVQTAGATIADAVVLRAETNPPGPKNNDCSNIWNGNGPENLGWIAGGAEVYFNPYFILPGFSNFLSGDFENATDCNPDFASAFCNGSDHSAIASAEDRDLWYVFQVPPDSCSSLGLTTSTVIEDMVFTYNAGSAFEDAYLYVYSNCNDSSLIDCSGSLDGASPGTDWTVSGLDQGEFYLLRIKPDDISSTGIENEFDFDITLNNGEVRPCNNNCYEPNGLEGMLPVGEECDPSGLPVYSAQGVTGQLSKKQVWFTFVAPDNEITGGIDPFDGNFDIANLYVEELENFGSITVDIYTGCNSVNGEGQNELSTLSGSNTTSYVGGGDREYLNMSMGRLIPGQTYYVGLSFTYGSSLTTEQEVLPYKICAYVPGVDGVEFGCEATSASGLPGSSSTNDCDDSDTCTTYYKVVLPYNANSGYYRFEVEGDGNWDPAISVKLMTNGETFGGSTGTEDKDNPCANLINIDDERVGTGEFGTLPNTPAEMAKPYWANNAEYGVFNLIGGSAGNEIYYYIKVTSESGNCGLINSLSFYGPFDAIADANNTSNVVGDEPICEGSDNDLDGIPDDTDLDDDNDGIPDSQENAFCGGDCDGDGIPNQFDLDSDDDGIADVVEAGGTDSDGNGYVDNLTDNGNGTYSLTADADGDGWDDNANNCSPSCTAVDVTSLPLNNSDANGRPDFLDIDADNDGIVDHIEAQTTIFFAKYITHTSPANNEPRDFNQNGWADTQDGSFGGTPFVLADTDGDGIPDYRDTDADNDNVMDVIEAWDTNGDGNANVTASGNDTDDDGLDDAWDVDGTATTNSSNINETDNNLDIAGSANALAEDQPTDFPDDDNPGTDMDWREYNSTCACPTCPELPDTGLILSVSNCGVVDGSFTDSDEQDAAALACIIDPGCPNNISFATWKAAIAFANDPTNNVSVVSFAQDQYNNVQPGTLPFGNAVGYDITLDGLYIDLNGATVDGDNSESGTTTYANILADNVTIANVNFVNWTRVIRATDVQNLTLCNVTIDASDINGIDAIDIRSETRNTSVNMLGITVTNNTGNNSRAISILNASSTAAVVTEVIICNSTFSCNTTEQDGAAIFTGNVTASRSPSFAGPTLCISNSMFSKNESNEGGAMLIERNSIVKIENSDFVCNDADGTTGSGVGGGAIKSIRAEVLLVDCEFTGNTSAADGAAIVNFSGSTADPALTIDGCSFYNNIATGEGGALYSHRQSTTTVSNSYFNGNSAGDGGGIYIDAGPLGSPNPDRTTFSLTNSTITANVSGGSNGGGIHIALVHNGTDEIGTSNGDSIAITNSVICANNNTSDNGQEDLTEDAYEPIFEDGFSALTIDASSVLGEAFSDNGVTNVLDRDHSQGDCINMGAAGIAFSPVSPSVCPASCPSSPGQTSLNTGACDCLAYMYDYAPDGAVTTCVPLCDDGEWIHYGVVADSIIYFSIRHNGNDLTGTEVDVYVEDYNVDMRLDVEQGSSLSTALMRRGWNARVMGPDYNSSTGITTYPASVRFYYPESERTIINTTTNAVMLGASNIDQKLFSWFKSNDGLAYNHSAVDVDGVYQGTMPATYSLDNESYSYTVPGPNGDYDQINFVQFDSINGFSGGSGSGGTVPTGGVALPVELLSFFGEAKENTNLLYWTTALEINSSHFEIERSLDGLNFLKIGSVSAAVQSTELSSYNYEDFEPSETSYYRLKQVDLNGVYTYSNIVVVSRNFTNSFEAVIYPNPASNSINIELLNWDMPVDLVVYNLLGNVIYSQENYIKGRISCRGWAAGVYSIQIRDIEKNVLGYSRFQIL